MVNKIKPYQMNVDKLKENILSGTTLEDYGITDAAPKESPTFTGTMTVNNLVINGTLNIPGGRIWIV